jgi:hypothetical protein
MKLSNKNTESLKDMSLSSNSIDKNDKSNLPNTKSESINQLN